MVRMQAEVMEEVKENAIKLIKDKIPSLRTAIQAGIAAIPWIGGSLDHLIFDKSEEIRMRNIEMLVKELTESMKVIQEIKISKDWFESIEAIDMFKNLYGKVEFESDTRKIRSLSNLYCCFGTVEHKNDPNKLAVLEIVSKMTNNQKIIFMAVNKVPIEEKTSSTNGINYTAKSRWLSSIIEFVRQKEVMSQLDHPPFKIELLKKDGKLESVVKRENIFIDLELDILASLNLLRIDNIPNMMDTAYEVTALGRLTYSYLRETS